MKLRLSRNRLKIAASVLIIGSLGGCRPQAVGPTSDPAKPPTILGRSQYELDPYFIVIDEREISQLPKPAQQRLSAFEGNTASRRDQILDDDESTALAKALQYSFWNAGWGTLRLRDSEARHAVVESQQAYVSSLTEMRAPGAALFDPQISTVSYGGEITCEINRQRKTDANNLSIDLRLTRLVTLVPVKLTTKVDTPAAHDPVVVTGTYQIPITAKYTLHWTSLKVPDGKAILLSGFQKTVENGDTAATQPSITAENETKMKLEKHQKVFVLLKTQLIAFGEDSPI